jgi:lipopolysaccharide biosynthesis regulator YciM
MTIPVSDSSRAASPPRESRRRRRRWLLAGLVLGTLALCGWGWAGGARQLLGHLAARALARRELDAAARWLAWAHRIAPADARAELLRARLARRRQDYQGVRDHLLRAAQLGSPRDLLEREQSLASAQAGQLRDAELQLPRLLIDPRDDGAEICEAYVTGYLLTYQTGKAHRLLDAWENDFPADPLPSVVRARLYVEEQNWTAAERSLRRALALEPDNPETAVSLGEVLASRKQYAQALEWYERGSRGKRERLPAALGAAQCLQALGRHDEAQHTLTAVADEFPASAPLLFARAQLELEKRNDGEARELLERARKGDPHNPEILYALAAILRRCGQPAEADDLAGQARKIVETRARIGRLVEKVAARSDDVAARYEIGTLHLEYGSEQEGLMWLKSVLQFQPEHAGARAALQRYGHVPDESSAIDR